ncbi:hypothetical protein VE04_02500 [Pseudogymnoascus sp. 24MN13]|nr:hypothetical protein VE04_02500 [Pseudogymnoascus sp. 24MN13]
MPPSADLTTQPPAAEAPPSTLPSKQAPHVHGSEEKTPLQAISHGILMDGIPTFSSPAEHRKHILIHTAATFRDFARKGFTEGQAGHISVRDPEFEDYIWMNPLGRHFGLMTAGDMICLDMHTGAVVGGNNTRPADAAGFQIHSAIHKARPDVAAICHAHSDAGRAASAHAVYAEYGGIVFAEEEGRNIARALGEGNKGVILMNHGLLTVGHTVDEAGYMFGLLGRGEARQLDRGAAGAGNPGLKRNIISDEEAAYNMKMASEKHVLYREAQPDLDYIFETQGVAVVARGVDNMVIDEQGGN